MEYNVSSSYSYLQTAGGRVNGLASGIDTESIVNKLMMAASAPMEQLQKQKQTYEWQRDAYRDVNTKLSTFNDTIFDKFGLQGSLASKTISVSNSDKVSVTSTPTTTGTLNIQNITQLATVASTTANLDGYTSNESTLRLGLTVASGSVTLNVLQSDGTMKETIVNYKSTDTLNTLSKYNNCRSRCNSTSG